MRGLTLIELIVTLAVLAVLAGFALPAMLSLVQDARATAVINQLVGQVRFARSAALTAHRRVTLCPGRGGRCGRRNTWHDGTIAFIDVNRNGRVDSGERVLREFPGFIDGTVVTWRAFGNRSSLTIRANGLTAWQNGSFRYCPPNGDVRYARQAIINAQARVRHARDQDGDGVREDPQGRALTC